MNIRITVRGIENKGELREQAERRVGTALNRFAGGIHRVTVLLEDVTGPRKQVIDKRCRIDVRLRRGGEVLIDELGTDMQATLSLALDRLKAAICRKAGKAKRGVGAG